MSVQNPPAYRVAWRAAKYGSITHAVITELHPLVRASWTEDPNGGPYDDESLDRQLAHHGELGVRPERPSDRRCQICGWIVAEADSQVKRAARLWAIEQLRGVLDELSGSAPIAPPAHER